ncbi:MAG: rhodanese-like domain-containing protein [Candidatus Thermoplasmatota archaeon]|nr:rhodanese-like domain-containing protein [Candidatus Thermoplasmatota archaeon]
MNSNLKELKEKIGTDALIALDIRTSREFSKAHIPGSISAPYSSWGWGSSIKEWLNGTPSEIMLISSNPVLYEKASDELKKLGVTVHHSIADDLKEWVENGLPVSSLREIEPKSLSNEIDQWEIIDVREPYELNYGMIKGARNVPMSEVQNLLDKLDRNKKYAIVCAHGNRSEAAAIFLSDNGFHAATMVGGMAGWMRNSLPIVYPE